MPLQSLDCTAIPVSDFSILEALPLRHLTLASTPIDNLTFLRRLPLESLSLESCIKARHFEVLADILSLETLILPAEYPDLPEEELLSIESLRHHPALRKILYRERLKIHGAPQTKEEFWKDFDLERHHQGVLMQACHGERHRFRRREGTWYVNLEEVPITDLSPLAGIPISVLLISGARISDLTPLRGMPLQVLFCASTLIKDLEPLRDLPLVRVYLDDCPQGLDLEPLANAKKLYSLLLPPNPRNLEKLRELSNLKYLSYEADKGDFNRFEQTAEEFWKGEQPVTAQSLARQGKFSEAEKLLRQKLKTSRAVEHWESLAAVLLAQGAYDRYQTLAEEMIQNPTGDTLRDLYTMRVCLLTPVQCVPLDRIKPLLRSLQLLEHSMELGAWYLEVKAMLEIRGGSPASAIATLSEVGPGRRFRKGPSAGLILAMAHMELGEREAAGADVAAAQAEIIQRWPAPSYRATYWHEWLLAYLLLEEVERQLKTLPRASR
jgi:hypothetical protein